VCHLRKHIKPVEHFYKHLAKSDYQSEIAVKYRKRFDKNQTSLFTFLEHVAFRGTTIRRTWIKAFGRPPQHIGGDKLAKMGLREEFTLLSDAVSFLGA